MGLVDCLGRKRKTTGDHGQLLKDPGAQGAAAHLAHISESASASSSISAASMAAPFDIEQLLRAEGLIIGLFEWIGQLEQQSGDLITARMKSFCAEVLMLGGSTSLSRLNDASKYLYLQRWVAFFENVKTISLVQVLPTKGAYEFFQLVFVWSCTDRGLSSLGSAFSSSQSQLEKFNAKKNKMLTDFALYDGASSIAVVMGAAKNGNLDILTWFAEHALDSVKTCLPKTTPNGFNIALMAALYGQANVIDWIITSDSKELIGLFNGVIECGSGIGHLIALSGVTEVLERFDSRSPTIEKLGFFTCICCFFNREYVNGLDLMAGVPEGGIFKYYIDKPQLNAFLGLRCANNKQTQEDMYHLLMERLKSWGLDEPLGYQRPSSPFCVSSSSSAASSSAASSSAASASSAAADSSPHLFSQQKRKLQSAENPVAAKRPKDNDSSAAAAAAPSSIR